MRRATAGALAVALLAPAAACREERTYDSFQVATGGDPARGRHHMHERGCHACHELPGSDEPGGHVGPPLAGIARRTFIAGQLPNTPANLVRWVRDPHAIEPGTAMPDLGLTEEEARDVAAYLYTLE